MQYVEGCHQLMFPAKPGKHQIVCVACRGFGAFPIDKSNPRMTQLIPEKCWTCDGTGLLPDDYFSKFK